MIRNNYLICVFWLSIFYCAKSEAQSYRENNDSSKWNNVVISEYLDNDTIKKVRKRRRFYSSSISFYSQFHDSLTIYINGQTYAKCFVATKRPRNMYDTIFHFERQKLNKDTIYLLFNNTFKVPLNHLKTYEYLYIYHYYGIGKENVLLLYYSNEGRYYLLE